MTNEEEIQQLKEKIQKARQQYYDGQGEVQLEDEEFDALEERLKILAPKEAILEKVGEKPVSGPWQKSTHPFHMGSLNKVKGRKELEDWWKKIETHETV